MSFVQHFHEVDNTGLDHCHGVADVDTLEPVAPDSHFVLQLFSAVKCGHPYRTGDVIDATGELENAPVSAIIVGANGRKIPGTPVLQIRGYHVSPYGTLVFELS